MLLTAGDWADFQATVHPGIAFEAHTDSIHTPALVIAVTGTGQLAAVLTSETLITDTLSIKALALEVTVSRTFCLRAVGTFPSCFTNTATSFSTEVAPTTAEGPGVQTACNEDNRYFDEFHQSRGFWYSNESNLTQIQLHP